MTHKIRGGFGLILAGLLVAGFLAIPNPVLADVKVRVYVPAPPPPPPAEVIGVAPSGRHVWIGGFHRWDGRAYVWTPGSWVVRPRPRAHWVAGHWGKHRRGYYWVEGHWR
jgi:hypothetical protein